MLTLTWRQKLSQVQSTGREKKAVPQVPHLNGPKKQKKIKGLRSPKPPRPDKDISPVAHLKREEIESHRYFLQVVEDWSSLVDVAMLQWNLCRLRKRLA